MNNSDIILVYHGSVHIIQAPVYLGRKDDNDYGNGFYTTEDEERAKSWAALNGDPVHSIVNKYELDISGLNVLDLADFGVLAWIAEVVSHRGTSQEAAEILGKKSEKAFSQIKWIGSYETESEEKYVDNDLRARREVNKFMQGRMRAILTDGFIVPGITARYAVQSKLIYHRENDYYE